MNAHIQSFPGLARENILLFCLIILKRNEQKSMSTAKNNDKYHLVIYVSVVKYVSDMYEFRLIATFLRNYLLSLDHNNYQKHKKCGKY